MDSKTYKVNNSEIKLKFGNLFTSNADVLVISGSIGLPMIGGLPENARTIAGESVLADAAKHPDAKLGDVIVTGAGLLPNKYLFQAITVTDYKEVLPHLTADQDFKADIIEYIIGHAISKSLRLLAAMDLKSIAMPCLGLGMANMPMDAVAKITAKNICNFLKRTNKKYSIEIYMLDTYDVYSRFNYLPFFEWMAAYSHATKKDIERETEENEDKDWNSDDIEIKDLTDDKAHKHKIFISYSRLDSEKARSICGLLNELNIPYWIDINGVYSGANFKEKIVSAISSSELVLFLSSKDSNASPNVAKEIAYADRYGKIIIPVRLDASPMNPAIEYDLSAIDYVDLFTFDEKNVKKLKNAILGQLAMNNAL